MLHLRCQIYEWALEAMHCVSSVNLRSARKSSSKLEATLGRVQEFVDDHPSPLSAPVERQVDDMLAKINSGTLDEMWNTARQRYTCTRTAVICPHLRSGEVDDPRDVTTAPQTPQCGGPKGQGGPLPLGNRNCSTRS